MHAALTALSILALAACSGPVTSSRADPDVTVGSDAPVVDASADLADSTLEAPTDASPAGDSTPRSVPEVVGGDRPARVIAPPGLDPTLPTPVVLLLGGYDYFARDLDDWLELSDRVASDGFVLVLPDGLVDSDGSPYWNATDTCCDYDGTGVDDVAYLTSVMDELDAHMRVQGFALVGHSAGGFMAYRLGCEVPQRLSALVSIAGSGFVDPRDCAVRDVPLTVLQVHGDEDDVMPFDGDSEAPGALEMLDRWAGIDGCDVDSWVLRETSTPYAEEGDTSIGRYASGCTSGAEVRLWLLGGSDHYPTFTTAFVDDLLAHILAATRAHR
ncbi:MAG: hypothetical protein IT385_03790 [Deltaproteobacteria bacterium]|nr:hypothetical protein [Deltaproteobacteria bacterium]